MGCSAALALAERGARVTIFERENGLLRRAAVSGEAKIHLGYVYANDASLATAWTMIKGARAFAPFFHRHLGASFDFRTSRPFYYPVHRDSLLTVEAVADHLAKVHAGIAEAFAGSPNAYFGACLARTPERLSAKDAAVLFNAQHVGGAFRTEEIAINADLLAGAIAAHLAADPAIEIMPGCSVRSVEAGRGGLTVLAEHRDGALAERFDHVVNAAWAGRLAIDGTVGMTPSRSWLFRLKYGIRLPPGSAPAGLVSATFVLGPFGDVVRLADDSVYLSWYPVCMTARSRQVAPPRWRGRPRRARRKELVAASFAAMSPLMPALAGVSPEALHSATVKGDAIFAWGFEDIDDRHSELHRRADIGLATNGRYHSVDPGKLTMAPWFAERCVERIFS